MKDYDLVGHDFEPTSLYDNGMAKWLEFLVRKVLLRRIYDLTVALEELYAAAENDAKYLEKVSKEITKEIQGTAKSYLEGRYYGVVRIDDATFLSDENGVFETQHVESLFKTDTNEVAKEVRTYIIRFLKAANEEEATNTMTVSKMIKKLKELEREHGDLPMKAFMYCGAYLEPIYEDDVRVRFHELVDGNKVGKEVVIEGTA